MLKYGIVVLNALKIISSKYFSKNDLENGQKNVISYFGSKILICYKTSIDFKNNAKWMNRNSSPNNDISMVVLIKSKLSIVCAGGNNLYRNYYSGNEVFNISRFGD